MTVKESEKPDLKLNIQKTKIMASGPIASWQIEEEKVEQWQVLFSWVQNYCSHKIRRPVLLRREAITNLDSVLKTETSLCW